EGMPSCPSCGGPVSGGVCKTCGQATSAVKPVSSQPSNGKMGKIIAFIVATIIVLSILPMVFLAISGPKEGCPVNYCIEMTDTNTIEMDSQDRLEGSMASTMRWSIDTMGNSDGMVTENEVEEMVEIMEMMVGMSSYSLRLNDYIGTVSQYNVSISGATGDVSSTYPITTTTSIVVDWEQVGLNETSYEVQISIIGLGLFPFGSMGGDLRFTAPPGYKISNVLGLTDVMYYSGHTVVIGSVTLYGMSGSVSITLEKQ
ncbi:MAG: hypothetical protein JSV43_04170, partial [Methanobacteriota archaeon]